MSRRPADGPADGARRSAARGRSTRKRVERSQLARLPTDRSDPLALLASQDEQRLPELVPLRRERMAASPFSFYRGAALVMADDLSRTPDSGILVHACGDAHLSNFGVYSTPERNTAFDLNDFDEVHLASFEWDVKRLAASVVVAGRCNGIDDERCAAAAAAAARSYRTEMRTAATRSNLDTWYMRIPIGEVLSEIGEKLDTSRAKSTVAALRKARDRNSAQALRKLTVSDGTRARFRSDPPLLEPIDDLVAPDRAAEIHRDIQRRFADYRRTLDNDKRALFDSFELVEVARKVVGVGSVGTRCFVALFTGTQLGDPLVLQIKEADRSVLSRYVKGPIHRNQGKRVVTGQRLLQASSDIFLGWQSGPDLDGGSRDFYVRQLRDGKGSVVVEALEPDGLELYAGLCGRTLAIAHARAGDRFAIAGYVGKGSAFVDAITRFAMGYADLTERDHARFTAR
ncbi:DUF2252 domain-containing protein [Rhodococcus rhodnii]|uniref:DUF2252 domain-containing protein n=2 Tax=Rhodococcus rhodnii TaxID=38312 RepID=R7WI01_9NOCA|nr:DUF2252 domain-containing protein [Rhodococcus rhodnii]EOM74757.1 hypothetical protein Rrhod_3920 [Rhodococcus rhodnii LMG 5362]TXG89855.1 DUF2252 domain-containing protein [Rhodococcus rhodnii]